MNGDVRRGRFHARIRIERQFLVLVNRRFGPNALLAGMTEAAIDSWEARAGQVNSDVNISRVAKLLREAALRAELLADNSREIFEAGRKISPDGVAEIAEMLAAELSH